MQFSYQKPQKLLSELVKTVLKAEALSKSCDNRVPLYTSGMPAFLCRTIKSPTGIENVIQLTLFGKSALPDNWNLKRNETLITYFFKPFTLPVLFNLPAKVLAKHPVELSKWNAHKTNALKTQLAYSSTANEKIEALDNLLLLNLQLQKKECEIIRFATDQIILNPRTDILSVILKKLSITERTFQRIFKKYIGVTPNQYRRICQFKLSFDLLKNGQFEKLTDVAYNTGFSDQSHFTRSFKEFIRTTPKEYKKFGLTRKKT